MVLIPTDLADRLRDEWMVASGGSFPSTPPESGQRFAGAVSTWFATAMAGPFPCATAKARESQLAGQATAALQAGLPPVAGLQLANAVAAYYAGQLFGAGTASQPVATPAVGPAFAAVFSNPDLDDEDRALQLAIGCQLLALSTLVVFPPPMSPLPIL